MQLEITLPMPGLVLILGDGEGLLRDRSPFYYDENLHFDVLPSLDPTLKLEMTICVICNC